MSELTPDSGQSPKDPAQKAMNALIIGVLIVILTTAFLAFFLYSKLNHGS